MSEKPALHIVFTMNCQPAATRSAPEGPKSWEQSIRSIDGFSTRLINAGFPVTLFLAPRCLEEHGPFVEELAERGVELGLYFQPRTLYGRGYNRCLGHYARDAQRDIVTLSMGAFQDVVGERPLSCRSDWFSANDDTFSVVSELGFRQGSVSNPGRTVAQHAARWSGAESDAHYADRSSRLQAGDLPFLELPVTADSTQSTGGLSPDLAIENGTFEDWHRPLIEGQLERMDREGEPFRALCLYTRNCFAYGVAADRYAQTVDALIAYFGSLDDRYDVVPLTLAGAHSRYRVLRLEYTGR